LYLESDQTKNSKATYKTRTNAENFVKNIENESPLRYKFLAKMRNFDSFGAVFPHFCLDKREIWHGVAVPNFTFIGATCHPCVAKNPFLDHRVKTIRAGLPVTRKQYASPPRGNAILAGPLSDSDEILCCCGISRSALLSKISTLWV